MMTGHSPLSDLQRWMQSVITAPGGVAAGIQSPSAREIIDISPQEVERVIRPSSQLDSLGRLHVYGQAYFARLIECLEGEFPAVKHVLGEETFRSFALSYLHERPSTSYTLSELGRQYPDFLKTTRPADLAVGSWADFLIDLAHLEWTYSQVFNGPGTEQIKTLQPENLQGIGPEIWPRCRLKPIGCLRLEEYRFPVHEYASAVRNEQNPEGFPAAEPTWLIITRRDYIVRRTSVSEAEFAVLGWLCDGFPIEETIERAMATLSDEIETKIPEWFREWSRAGYFLSLETPV